MTKSAFVSLWASEAYETLRCSFGCSDEANEAIVPQFCIDGGRTYAAFEIAGC